MISNITKYLWTGSLGIFLDLWAFQAQSYWNGEVLHLYKGDLIVPHLVMAVVEFPILILHGILEEEFQEGGTSQAHLQKTEGKGEATAAAAGLFFCSGCCHDFCCSS